jgi:cytochrome c5
MAEHQTDAHVEEHSSFIKTPAQLVVVIVLAFVIPIAVITMLARLVTTGGVYDDKHPAMTDEAVAQRIKPVGQVTLSDPNAPKVVKSGEEVYKQICQACHATGVLNAPKTGDKAAWAKPISTGLEAVAANAIKGVRQMPARGGNPELSDLEVKSAIVYMANQSGADWKLAKRPRPRPKAAAAEPGWQTVGRRDQPPWRPTQSAMSRGASRPWSSYSTGSISTQHAIAYGLSAISLIAALIRLPRFAS